MYKYYCYEIWDFIEPNVTEKAFENDNEALLFWLGISEEHQLTCCFSITRSFQVDGVFHEEFIAMFRRGEHGLDIIKSHAL